MSQSASQGPVRIGMVGGGSGAFIGAVHRRAAQFDGLGAVIAGALSSTPAKAIESGRAWGLDPQRTYPTWQEMFARESAMPEHQRIEAVSIVTPNHTHFEIAKAAIEAGFHVVLDKPITHTTQEAEQLVELVRTHRCVFAVTYTFAGYPMVQQAARLVRSGAIGTLRRVYAEFLQGWLTEPIEQEGHKQASWRTDPAKSGPAGTLGDIGTHAEHLVAMVSGLEIESLCADVVTHVPGRQLDDDAAVLLKFKGGARGVLTCSQICAGEECGIRLRFYGDKGGLEWNHDQANQLLFKPLHAPTQVLTRAGEGLASTGSLGTRLPSGHPEGFAEAFANIYKSALETIIARRSGADLPEPRLHHPTVDDGLRSIRFIEHALESSSRGGVWVRHD